ncbi:hypothetical protein ENKNEFLB_02100 [Nocardioides aquaticus]|uniref:Uncharacterized protein n=1 Tax=Nocardioides aquaticus TaxID=160826 RepID=A0ABX8EGQ5_9ACTN|nr:hypothetical protein [Nocardioides aquaticus]QVT79710.1 hypothetical protein ENKNEFLB_02100 [Nocardioides aquaticus]
MPRPTRHDRPVSVPNPVWFGLAKTGIYHGDAECPAIESKLATRPNYAMGWVYELDRATGVAYLWEWGINEVAGWTRLADFPKFVGTFAPKLNLRLEEWRPCMRCGSLRSDGTYAAKKRQEVAPVVCTRCFLVGCDCSD